MSPHHLRHRRWLAGLALLAASGIAGLAVASDHQDTAEVELNPKQDLTDVYAFPGSAPGRIVLVMNTRAFLTPAETPGASFDPNLLYQFKIDNDGDAIEDKVVQVSFSGSGASQQVEVRGPVDPPVVGAMKNELASASPSVTRHHRHLTRLGERHAGLRGPARRFVLHRPRGGILHPARPEAVRWGALRALRAAGQPGAAVLLPARRFRRELRQRFQRARHRGRASLEPHREWPARQARYLGHHQPVTITMERIHIMRSRLFLAPRLALLALAGAATLSACSDDNGNAPTPTPDADVQPDPATREPARQRGAARQAQPSGAWQHRARGTTRQRSAPRSSPS